MEDDNLKNEGKEKGMGAGAGASQNQPQQAGRNPQDQNKETGGVGGKQDKPEPSRGSQGGYQEGSQAGSPMGGQQNQGRRDD